MNFISEQIMKKRRIVSLFKLMKFGGFIYERIRSEIHELYPEVVADMVLDTEFEDGRSFIIAADAVNKAFSRMDRFYGSSVDELTEEEKAYYEGFSQWYLKKVSVLSKEEKPIQEDEHYAEYSFVEKRALERMPILDREIFYCIYGYNGRSKMSAKEIAALPEFDCDERYIENVCSRIKKCIDNRGRY